MYNNDMSGIIEIVPSDDQIRLAIKNGSDIGVLHNSIEEGDGNVAGVLGEIVCRQYYDLTDVGDLNKHDYDLYDPHNRLKIDCKTKRCTSTPQPSYRCSVAAFNTSQKCDIYLFCRTLMDYSRLWILGWIFKDEFFEMSVFSRTGEIDLDSPPRKIFRTKADCYNIRIDLLRDPLTLPTTG